MLNRLDNETPAQYSMFQTKQHSAAIRNILHDYVIFRRIANSMIPLLNAVNPTNLVNCFEIEGDLKGHTITFLLMDIVDEDDLCENLSNVMFDIIDNENDHATVLADKIYTTWLEMIAICYINLKKVAIA
jgi:hypothetical protein